MGCENSKTVRVQPVGPASGMSRDNTQLVTGKEGATQTPEAKLKRGRSLKHTESEYDLDEHGNKVKKSGKKRGRSASTRDLMGSCDTLDDNRSLGSDRGLSASSKQSADSGLGEDYAHVITEYSQEDKVKQVEKAFKPRDDLELGVTGIQCSTRNSAKDRVRLEEAMIMQNLREEGLISKPEVQSSGGMCFEIVDASGDGLQKPPPRLEKLALERRRKKKRSVTEEEIREKLERAERRRKKREQERLEKLREMERTDAVAALENFAQYQKSKEETIAQRLDQAQDNKERKIREMKEKLERRKRHAEEVRKRKALAKENGTNETYVEAPDRTLTPRPEMTSKPEASPHSPPLQVAEARERSDSRSSRQGSARSHRE